MSRTKNLIALLALTLCAAPVCADEAESSVLGKVVGLYVQTARHLLVDVSMAQRSAIRSVNSTLIAEIRFAEPLGDGRTGTLATVDEGRLAGVDTGDVVKVALVESKGGKQSTAPLRRSDEVRVVEAKYHTHMAQTFAQPPARAASAFGAVTALFPSAPRTSFLVLPVKTAALGGRD